MKVIEVPRVARLVTAGSFAFACLVSGAVRADIVTNVWTGAAGNGSWNDAGNWNSNVSPVDLTQAAVWDFRAAADGVTITWSDTAHPVAILGLFSPQRKGSLTLAASADAAVATFPVHPLDAKAKCLVQLYSGFTLNFNLPYTYNVTRDGTSVITVFNNGTLCLNPRNGVFKNGEGNTNCRKIALDGTSVLYIGSSFTKTEDLYTYFSGNSGTLRFGRDGNVGHLFTWGHGVLDPNGHQVRFTVKPVWYDGKEFALDGTGEIRLENYCDYPRSEAVLPKTGTCQVKMTALTGGMTNGDGLNWPANSWLNLDGMGYFTFASAQSLGTLSGESASGQIRFKTPGTLQSTSARDSVLHGSLSNVTSLVKAGTGALSFKGDARSLASVSVTGGTLELGSAKCAKNVCAQLLFEDADRLGFDTASTGVTWTVKGKSAYLTQEAGGVTGHAIRFSAPTNDAAYLQYDAPVVTRPHDFPSGNDSFTVSLWFKPDPGTCFKRNNNLADLVLFGSNWSDVRMLWLYYASDNYIWLGDTERNYSKSLSSGKSFADGNWHHVVAQYDGAERRYKLYLDGAYQGQSNAKTKDNAFTATDALALGRRANGNLYNGLMDDVLVVKGLWTAEEVQNEYATKRTAFVSALPAPVAHYAFEDASQPGKDSSGNGYDLTVHGTVTVEDCWRPGTAGKCLKIDNGSGANYLSFDGATYPSKLPRGNSSFTVAVRLADGGNAEGMPAVAFGDHTTAYAHFDAGIYGYPRYFGANVYYSGSDAGSRLSSFTLTDTLHASGKNKPGDELGWTQLTFVYTAADTYFTVYRDGVYVKRWKDQNSIPLNLGTGDLYVGLRKNFNANNFKGLIDDIRIFDTALSQDEVRAVARDQAGLETGGIAATVTASVSEGATLKVSGPRTLKSVTNAGTLVVAPRSELTLTDASVLTGTVTGGDVVVPSGSTVVAAPAGGSFAGVGRLTLPESLTIRLSSRPTGNARVRYVLATADSFVLPTGFGERYAGWTIEDGEGLHYKFSVANGELAVTAREASGLLLIFR